MVQKNSKPGEAAPARRRGRPRQYDPERALAKAADVFWKRGYAATSLDDLVAATGMNRPSLYAAFGDKRDIYLKTLARYREQSRAIGVEILADDPPLRVFLKRFYQPPSTFISPAATRRAAAIRSRPHRRRRRPIRPCANSWRRRSATPTRSSPSRLPRRASGERFHRRLIRRRSPNSPPQRCILSPCVRAPGYHASS